MSDQELLSLMHSGDRGAFAELCRRYRRGLYAFCVRLLADTARPNFPEEVTQLVRNVLEGGSPDTGSVSRFVAGGAEAIAGGYLKPLVQALEEQRSGKQSIEQSRRLVVFCTGGMPDDGHSGFIVARTESRGKETRPHYHTIVIQQNAAGDWKIIHWHTSR